ncbi:MAG: ATP-grasp domain-containing protein [Paludibacteraceae bacterium]|nr:ATP-grasp domain-containing protein [Paludibacteraceae bacterium]
MKKAIVLGGTSPHVLLINYLHELDYEVILVDYLDNSPGIKVADKHIQASTLDKEAVCRIAKEEKVELVISTCIDQANSTCCYVAEKLGLPLPYSYQTSLDVTDKGRMKVIFKDGGIPTSDFYTIHSEEEIEDNRFAFPLVVKPVDCNSSKGVRKVDTVEELHKYAVEALSMSRTKSAIIEGFVEGFEIQVDCLALDGDADVLLTRQKKQIRRDDDIVLQSTGSIIPANLDAALRAQTLDVAKKIAASFGLKNTPFFYQAIVDSEGIKVLEFAPRIGGGLSYYILKNIAGVDVVKCAIQSFLGQKMQYAKATLDACYSTNLIYMHPGIFSHVEGFEELCDEGIVNKSFVMKTPGTEIDSNMSSGNRVAAFIVKASTYDELKEKERQAYAKIRVLDSHGTDLLNRKYI